MTNTWNELYYLPIIRIHVYMVMVYVKRNSELKRTQLQLCYKKLRETFYG